VNYGQIIADAVTDVFSTMLMMEVSPQEACDQSLIAIPAGASGMLGFSGDVAGMLTIHCPEAMALGITCGFLGMEVNEIDEDVKDAIGELVNMVAGGLKDGLAGQQREIKLAIPTTIAGRSFRISSKSDVGHLCLPFDMEAGRFYVELKYK
jgi:chemotaxis protein CheX